MLELEVILLVGAEGWGLGGHLGLSAGMRAGAHMGLLWELKGETVHIPTLLSPLPPSVCLHCLYNPAISPSLTHVNDGSEG